MSNAQENKVREMKDIFSHEDFESQTVWASHSRSLAYIANKKANSIYLRIQAENEKLKDANKKLREGLQDQIDSGYAQLGKLPKFSEEIAEDAGLQFIGIKLKHSQSGEDFTEDDYKKGIGISFHPERMKDFKKGARWQHSQDTKVIAAKDEKILEQKAELVSEHEQRTTLFKKLETADEKIRELEKELKTALVTSEMRGKSLINITEKLQAANSLIDELENYLKELRGVVITNWSNGKSISPGYDALEKIKQWRDDK